MAGRTRVPAANRRFSIVARRVARGLVAILSWPPVGLGFVCDSVSSLWNLELEWKQTKQQVALWRADATSGQALAVFVC